MPSAGSKRRSLRAAASAKRSGPLGSGWADARQGMIDARLEQVRGFGPGRLTDAQMDLYRLAMESMLPGADGLHRAMDSELHRARERLVREEGPIGEHMAELLTRAASSQQESGLMAIRAHNRADGEEERLRDIDPPSGPPLSSAGGPGADRLRVADLIRNGGNPIAAREARAMAKAAYGAYPSNGCAAHLSSVLKQSGIDVPMTLGAGALAARLEERGWERVPVGAQQPGDVGVTHDRGGMPGADHLYLVVDTVDDDKMVIADNQSPRPYVRHASGSDGKTGTASFLRAS